MKTKLSKLREAWSAGDKYSALRIASKFPRLGEEKKAITQGYAAWNNASFYKQIGKDPGELIEEAFEAMATKWEL